MVVKHDCQFIGLEDYSFIDKHPIEVLHDREAKQLRLSVIFSQNSVERNMASLKVFSTLLSRLNDYNSSNGFHLAVTCPINDACKTFANSITPMKKRKRQESSAADSHENNFAF